MEGVGGHLKSVLFLGGVSVGSEIGFLYTSLILPNKAFFVCLLMFFSHNISQFQTVLMANAE